MRFLRDAVITVLLLGTIGTIGVIALVRRGGLSASEEPTRFERSIAERLVRLSIPPEADRQQNPFAHQSETWRDAREHYLDHCAVCHGRDGRGQTELGARMYPPVPDFTSTEVQERSDGALYYIVQNGVRWTGMPAWKDEHSADETWRLVSLIRKMPTLTEGDMNITSPSDDQAPSPGERHQPHPHNR